MRALPAYLADLRHGGGLQDRKTAAVAQVRVVEVLAAVSLTTDLASGMPFEKGLQTCAVAASFARSLGLDRDAPSPAP